MKMTESGRHPRGTGRFPVTGGAFSGTLTYREVFGHSAGAVPG